MMRCSVVVTLAALLLNGASAREVVVLVHGIGGWGPTEAFGVEYWVNAGVFDKHSDIQVFTAEVGAVSSNWDRACELYAQIVGTQTDYGEAHRLRYGHNRYGRDFSGVGFLPEWNETNKVHFVGHSMGGPTVRMLELLLQEGDADEMAATGGSTSPLFTGGKSWIRSITTFAGVHDGSYLVTIFGNQGVNLIKEWVLSIYGLTSGTALGDVYDLDLEHWGLARQDGETFNEFFDRVEASSILDSEDISAYDLSLEGAEKLNRRGLQAYPEVYYYAYSSERTTSDFYCSKSLSCGWIEKAETEMWIPLKPFANQIGALQTPSSLRKNDGLVPESSSQCPRLGYSTDLCERYRGAWSPGRWYHQYVNLDHIQVLGWTTSFSIVADRIFEDTATRIYLLSQANSSMETIYLEVEDYSPPASLSYAAIFGITIASCLGIALGVYFIRWIVSFPDETEHVLVVTPTMPMEESDPFPFEDSVNTNDNRPVRVPFSHSGAVSAMNPKYARDSVEV